MVKLLAGIYFCSIFIVIPISIHCFPSNFTQFSEEGENFYYGNNFDEEGGIEEGRQKRIVISGLGATIAWSVLFTPLATMTVSKNFDLIDIMKRCNERKKAHYESKHPLTAFWESIACKETEAEAREKIVLIEIVKLAFQNLTPEARDLIAVEYEIFEQKMAKLRGDKDQQERLEWNVPGHRGKKFLCFLREFVNFVEPNIHDEGWENRTEKDHQFWRHCEESINKRRQMSWKGKTARSVQRWFERRKSTFECALRKIGKGFIWMGKLIMKWSGALENEIENEEKEKIEGECSKWKSILVDLKELAKNEGLEWPKHYQIDDGPLNEENFLMTAEEFFKKMREQFGASRDKTLGIFANYIETNSTLSLDWEIQQQNRTNTNYLHFPKGLRAIIDITLEEAQKTLEYYGLNEISGEQKKHFAMMEIRTAVANFFMELRKSEELKKIIFPHHPKQQNGFSFILLQFVWQNNLPEGAARDIFANENEINKDWLVAGNEHQMEAFHEIFLIQEGNKDLYRQIFLDALLDEKKSSHSSEENEMFEKMNKKNEQIEEEHGREKRALGAFTTLFFGIGMQQGYRHFNLLQLIRDCTIRSINYKSARCYPPPIIQEEIKLIQKAKEIAFRLIPKSAVDEINRKLSFYVKENLRRKNALVEIPLDLLEKNLVLTHPNLDRIKSVPIPIKSFKNLMPKIDSDGCKAMISVPSEQMRAAIEAKNAIPECANSLEKLANAIIQNATVQIPLKTYMEWEKDLNLVTDEKEIEFVKKRGKNMKIDGKMIGERLKMGGTIPNPKEILAPILKPGYFIDVDLKFFTDKNEKLDELELLHTPMKKLNELFKEKNQKVKIAIPINFLAERYKEPTLSVPFGLIQEWVNENENVPIIINEQFIYQMGTIRAIPVSTLWLSALLDNEEIVNIAGEHFIEDFEEIFYDNKSIEQFPMIIELQRNFKTIVKCEKICPERNFQGGQDFFKPTEQEYRKLNFNLDDLEIIDYLPLKMQNIKHFINEKRPKPRCPKNIFVTLNWLKKQKEKWEKEMKNEGKQQFIVPILWKFFDKKLKSKNAGEIDGKFHKNLEFTVPLEFLTEIMKTTQKIPVPSQMLSDAGLELPWKYALHLDCNAEYKFYDEETLIRCKIYHQKIQAIEEQKENGQQKESELTMNKQIHSEKYKID